MLRGLLRAFGRKTISWPTLSADWRKVLNYLLISLRSYAVFLTAMASRSSALDFDIMKIETVSVAASPTLGSCSYEP